ncbi:MAG: hypothetical protein AAF799_05520 [Myxococcota bacterium]
MRASLSLLSLSCGILLGGCFLEPESPPFDDGDRPYRDQWRTELDAPLELTGLDAIRTLWVGGPEYEGNFANRGDIVVQFHDEDRIVVEMRRFAHAQSSEQAQNYFDALQLWAYARDIERPMHPSHMMYPRPCVDDDGLLRDECAMRVYYEGLQQPVRTGADIRVTLPASYEGQLKLFTEDLLSDSTYLNRGNVCIEPTRAQISAELGRGIGLASIAGAEQSSGGTPTVAFDAVAADLQVDLPPELYTAVSLTYEDDSDKSERCWADIQVTDFDHRSASFGSTHSSIGGAAGSWEEGQPFDASVRLEASSCDVVAYTERPEDWTDEFEDQNVEMRGVVGVCRNCLREFSCAQLLPGN